ncbi:PaaI family thioesterase [Variovorax sp. J22R133]|uniref:PaaI family thioesterase n=1 Tax=Variovorax brevis TaxID=3053503 RepID=UPI002575BC23|nr:PaaI family thioesterase [Variovorax sp. J22R133]MDM0110948.1 PaaI family thioesterase [Variovorax sp. J22R133]
MSERDTNDLPVTRERIVATLQLMPYAQYLGIVLADNAAEEAPLFHLPFHARLVGNPALPAIHGGVVAGFMEAAALATTYTQMDEVVPPKLVDFSIDYLSSARAVDLYAQCEVHRIGRRIAAIGIRCWQTSPDAPVALARAHVFVAPSSSDASVV